MKPKLLFKFRPVTTAEQLARLIDSINNNKIFIPDYKKLNDPLESTIYMVTAGEYAGCSIEAAVDEESRYSAEKKREYRVLSLAESCFSPSMWAHYANEQRGICIGYRNQGVFTDARKVEYLSSPIPASSVDETGYTVWDKVDEEIEKAFFYKHSDWKHEKEWRIVRKQEDSYLHYNSSDLACIIFGESMNKDVKQCIIASMIHKPILLRSKIGYQSVGINLLPIDYELQMDGSNPPFIRSMDDLTSVVK